MKILIVTQYFFPENLRINDIAKTLAQKGNKVTVLTGLPNYPSGVIDRRYRLGKRKREIINGVEVIRTWVLPRGKTTLTLVLNYLTFLISGSLKALFLQKNYDVVYAYQLSPITSVIPALVYKKITRAKVLLYCLDLWPESVLIAGRLTRKTLSYRLINKISRYIYRRADRILVTTETFVDHLSRIHQIKRDKLAYLPQYEPNEKLFLKLPIRQYIQDKFINITLMGSLNKAQDIETIILVINELKNEQKITWHIVGDGSSREKAQAMAGELNLKRVIFYGHASASEIAKIFAMTDAFIVSLKTEKGIPEVLPGRMQTFMASGRVIIGAINGSGRGIIDKAQCGWSASSGDYRVLAKNIREFANRGVSWERFALNSRKYYSKNFSKKIHLEKLISELTKLSK